MLMRLAEACSQSSLYVTIFLPRYLKDAFPVHVALSSLDLQEFYAQRGHFETFLFIHSDSMIWYETVSQAS